MPNSYMSTDALAAAAGVKPASIRSRLCKCGHYFGLRPTKLANRFLAWPADAAERLAATGDAEAPTGARRP